MSKFKHAALIALIAASASVVSAQPLIDTSAPNNIFSFGARIGVNTSNQSSWVGVIDGTTTNHNWGTGFDAGVVVDINLRNFFVLQPGFFFQTRSYNYTATAISDTSMGLYQGHTRSSYFKIPVVGSFRMNFSKLARLSLDFGPYLSLGLTGRNKGDAISIDLENGMLQQEYSGGFFDSRHRFDLGLKLGAGINILSHYYFGVHYEAGLTHVFKNDGGGKNKAWMFTLGYDF